MNKIINWFKEEYINGYKPFDYIFMLILLIAQIVVFIIDPGTSDEWINVLSIIAGITGTISTVLCAKGKITYLVYGFIQTSLFLIISCYSKLWIEAGESIFYLISILISVFVWKKNLIKTEEQSVEVKAKKLSKKGLIFTGTGLLVFAIICYCIDKFILYGAQVELDALSLALTVFAQILCTYCYKEQWILWLVLDVIQVIMFILIGNYVLAVMYIGWTINCIYGWYQWSKNN